MGEGRFTAAEITEAYGAMHARVAMAVAVIAGCYEAPAAPSACAITCTDGCPGDLSCVNGFCVKDGEVCAPVLQHVSAGAGYACALDGLLGRTGEFWHADYFDTFMRDSVHERRTIRYIENNPVKAKLARSAKDWPWSSARFRDEYGNLDWDIAGG